MSSIFQRTLRQTFSKYVVATLEKDDQEEIDNNPYGGNKNIIICPEPLQFLDSFGSIGANQMKTRKLFEQLSKRKDLGFKMLRISSDNTGIWFNTTKRGITYENTIRKSARKRCGSSINRQFYK